MVRGRPLLGAALALGFLVGPLFLVPSLEAERNRQISAAAERAAHDVGARARDTLTLQKEAVTLMVDNAVANPRLLAAMRGRVDQETFDDLFASEKWWESYRSLAAAISYEGDKFAFAALRAAPGLRLGEIVAAARSKRQALTEILSGSERAFIVAAKTVSLGEATPPAVLVLAKPIDDVTLLGLAERAGGALLLSDGKRALGQEGDSDVLTLGTAVGHEREGTFHLNDPAWAAVALNVGRDVWLWASGGASAVARERMAAGTTTRVSIWAGAILMAALSLFFTLRKRPIAPPSVSSERLKSDAAAAASDHSGEALQPTPPPVILFGSGDRLGRYLLVDRIGEGGMAEVFTAVSTGAGGFRRSFVIKRLRPEMTGNSQAVAHFIDEANLAASLVHPNIVPVFDFGEISGHYYLAQEYVVGRDIGRLVMRMWERGVPRLSPESVLFVGHEVLSGLDYAHTKTDEEGVALELVHRDVAPGNVMISHRGEVKILDFGIVKTSHARLAKTDIGIVKGNVDFMAPEQARGRPVDQRTDLFSLGLLLYYCATQQTLYNGDTAYERLSRAANGPSTEDLARIAALADPLPQILTRALNVDTEKRYQSAAEMRAALAPHMRGGQAELAKLMEQLFSYDFKQEQDRLIAAVPRASGGRLSTTVAHEKKAEG